MNTAAWPVGPVQAAHLHERVRRAHVALSQRDWRVYLGLAQQLPLLLRENGLCQTVRFLRQQATDKPAAARLVTDWLCGAATAASVAGLEQAAQQQGLAPPWERVHPHYRVASRLALAEAQRLRRSAEALGDPLPGGAAPAAERRTPERASRAFDAGAASSDPAGLEALLAPPSSQVPDGREHPSLLLRFAGMPAAPSRDKAATYKSRHIADVLSVSARRSGNAHAALYKSQFERWKRWATRQAIWREATLQGRLHLALGSPTVFETQVLLHPVHGMPYLPGSTLKGALRAHLARRIAALPADDSQRKPLIGIVDTLLGESRDSAGTQAGEAVLLDAWWVPDEAGPLVREVETPHHLEYQSGQRPGVVASAFDNPVPVAQIAIRGGFLLAVGHHRIGEAWAGQVLAWLLEVLADPDLGGLGGKAFAAGYGRLKPEQAAG
jgi:CRISPR type III-B/RAMP module RAMP protein Cmr6